ncbi:MAG: TolC family protein [Treponema sp.]|nr:TolC family protein [Treponema sp.]
MVLAKKQVALLLGTFLVTAYVFVQEAELPRTSEPRVLTVDNAVQQALDGNINIKKDSIVLAAAKRAKVYSWNSIGPTLTGSAQYSKTLPGQESAGAASNAGRISLTASLGVKLAPSLYTSVRDAALSYQKAEIDYDTAVRTIELSVRKGFYSILNEQDKISLYEKKAASAKSQYETNLAKYNRGALSRLDVLTAQVSWQNAQFTLESASSSLQNTLALFKQTLGIPQEEPVSFEGSLKDMLNLSTIDVQDVEAQSPTIASLQAQLEIAKNSLLASRFTAYGPTLSAGYSYSFQTTTESGSDWNNVGTVSLGATISLDGLLPWSNGAQGIAARKDAIRTAQLQLDDARTTLQVGIQNGLNKIKQSQDNIKLLRSSVDLARQSYAMTQEAYTRGTRDLLTLQTAEDKLYEAEINLSSEAYNLISAILDLENTVGAPFGSLIDKGDSQ